MSSLYKLSIQGIRSFDSERHETIQFGFPLTLICGQNGCGKTTIIECLKYATTGDLPPNSKGGAFVNDPSISSRSTVTAQVKLAFLNANGKSMIATRTMQLTRRKNRTGTMSNTFKTLDGQLAVIHKGSKSTMSTKNAELDSSIPRYLGTSRAILDNVIFCHQDESLWPLSEASVLKKRFDDIFEALKFAKVLDNLKSIKKEMLGDIKLIEQSVQHLKIDKERARKINDKITNLNNLAESRNEEIASITVQIENKEREAENLFSSNQSFQETISKFQQLSATKKSYEEQRHRLKKSITLLQDSDEELMAKLHNHESILSEKTRRVSGMKENISGIDKNIAALKSQQEDLIRLEGSFRFKEEEYWANLKRIQSLVLENKDELPDSVVIDNEFTPQKVQEMKLQFDKLREGLHESYKRSTQVHDKEESEMTKEAQDNQYLIQRENQKLETSMHDYEKLEKSIFENKRKLVQLQASGDNATIVKSQIENLVSLFNSKKSEFNIPALEKEIEEDNTKLSFLDVQLDELTNKLSLSQVQSDTQIKLSVLEDRIAQSKSNLSDLILKNKLNFEETVGRSLDSRSCSEVLELRITEISKRHAITVDKFGNERKEYVISENSILSEKGKIDTQDQKLSGLRESILQVISEDEIKDYEVVLSDLEEDYKVTLEALNTFEVTKQFKTKAIEIANKESCCVLCMRSFDSKRLQNFLDLMRKDVLSMDINKLRDNFETAKKDLDAVKDISSAVYQYKDLLEEAHASREKLEHLEIKDKTLKESLDIAKAEVEKLSKELEQLKSLRTLVSNMERLSSEISSNAEEAERLRKDTPLRSGETLSSKLQKDHRAKTNEMRALRDRIRHNNEFKFLNQNELSRLESEIKDKKLLLSNIEKASYEVLKYNESISEMESIMNDLSLKTRDSRDCIDALNRKQVELDKKLEECKTRNKEDEKKMTSKLNKLDNFCRELTVLYLSIQKFLEEEKPEYEKLKMKLQDLSKSIDDAVTRRAALESELKSVEKMISESSIEKSTIRDNLEYRSLCKEIEGIGIDMDRLDIKNAEKRREEYKENSLRLREVLTSLNAEHAGKVGEVRQIKDQISSLRSDLSNEYNRIDENYREEWIKLQTNVIVSNDVETYSKALDNAIMKYHGIKMADINKILGELWRQTYKGTDIDTICIKSDVNVQAKGNRSYNYRVVMYKQEVELDMRGRCSAGQKVLTSILIRLALAECFGSNCGMIALDEPTTNLDQENAESLAYALNRIIEYRREQKNFQLIIITHDENFLSHINGDKFTDHFYRVQRDELQKSIIRSLPIELVNSN